MREFINYLKRYVEGHPLKAVALMIACCAASFSAQACRVGYWPQTMPSILKLEKGLVSILFLAIAAYIMNAVMDKIENKTKIS